jgi:predicted PurR-regulated permease PerM
MIAKPLYFTDSHHVTPKQRQWLIWGGAFAALLWLVYLLRPILTPFVVGALLAYMVEPAVAWLSARKPFGKTVPREAAVVFMVFAVVLLSLGLVLIMVPLFTKQFAALVQQAPAILEKINTNVVPLVAQWTGVEIQLDTATIKAWLTKTWQTTEGLGHMVWSSLTSGSAALAALLGNIFLTPLIFYYFSSDWPLLIDKLDKAIPRRWHAVVLKGLGEVNHVLAEFFRGQVSLMLVLAAYYALGLKLAGLEFALSIGILTGLLVFIPYIGFALGVLLAALVGVLQYAAGTLGVPGIVGIVAVFAIGQVLESVVLTPKLVGERVGLPALAVLFALMAFGQLFGFFGVLVAVPASAVLLVVLRSVRAQYFASAFYKSRD